MKKELAIYINNTIKQVYKGHYNLEAEKVIRGFLLLLSLGRTLNSEQEGIEINFNKTAINKYKLENPDKLLDFLIEDNVEYHTKRTTKNSGYNFTTAKKNSLLETIIIDLEKKIKEDLDKPKKEKKGE